jgi:formate C-acetyltransferase
LSYHIPGGIISLPGILELALNNGVHRVSGLQLGAKTGDAKEFTSYNQLWEAFCTQVRTVIPHCHNIKNADKAMYSAYMPSPCLWQGHPIPETRWPL